MNFKLLEHINYTYLHCRPLVSMFQVGNQCSFLITDVASAHVFHFNSYEVVSQQIMLCDVYDVILHNVTNINVT